MAEAVAIDDLLATSYQSHSLAQVGADHPILGCDEVANSESDLVDSMLTNMAQDGVIRIPLKKEQTNFFSQAYAEADLELFDAGQKHADWLKQPQEVNQLVQSKTYDTSDPEQLR